MSLHEKEHYIGEEDAEKLYLGHQFEDFGQQTESYTVGMWIFLVTEIMFFGGLFAAFIVYKTWHPEAFWEAHNKLDIRMGFVNTLILLTSSLTVALGVRAAMLSRWKAQIGFLLATIGLAFGFMFVKYFEYSEKWEHHLIPGPGFHYESVHERGVEMFFALYFAMTGLHGIHVLIGIIVMAALVIRTYRMRHQAQDFIPVELAGLYWHFVDIVWIFLYPLLYLMGK